MNSPIESSSWLWVAAALSFIAAIGGIVVLRGLWLEGYKKHDSFSNIGEFRAHHTRESKGIKLVFWGVLIEVIVAFTMTFKEAQEAHNTEVEIRKTREHFESEMKETAKNVAKSDPRNAPIILLKGEASFLVQKNSTFENDGLTNGGTVVLKLGHYIPGASRQLLETWITGFVSSAFTNSRVKGVDVTFSLGDVGTAGGGPPLTLNRLDVIQMDVWSQNNFNPPSPFVVLGGRVELTVNSQFRTEFLIPQQTNASLSITSVKAGDPESNPFGSFVPFSPNR